MNRTCMPIQESLGGFRYCIYKPLLIYKTKLLAKKEKENEDAKLYYENKPTWTILDEVQEL